MKNNTLDIVFIKKNFPLLFKIFTVFPGALSLLLIFVVVGGYFMFMLDLQGGYYGIVYRIAVLILTYFVRFLVRSFEYIIFVFLSATKVIAMKKIRFGNILFEKGKLSVEERSYAINLPSDLTASEIAHRCIVPTYKESYEILKDTVLNIAKSDWELSKVAVTLAGEEGDKENFLAHAQRLEEEFKNIFGFFGVTVHPKGVPGELAGKGANITYSAHDQRKQICEKLDVDPRHVLVTTLDADTNVDKDYFSILTYTYLITPDRQNKSYQPMIFFSNNFRDAPFFSKIVSLSNSFFLIFNFMKKFGTRNFSTHAQPLNFLVDVDFRSTQTIVEDGHQYRRSYFGSNGNYECVPIYTRVYQDCNQNKNVFLTAKAQYNQIRRRAHGAEDMAYVVCQMVYRRKEIPKARTFYELLRLVEGTLMRSTLHIILSFGLIFSLVRDVSLGTSISLGTTISLFMNLSSLNMIIGIFLQMLFVPRQKLPGIRPKIRETAKFIFYSVLLIGPTLLIFSGLPAIHTQIALMLGKPMKKFNVTEKIRR